MCVCILCICEGMCMSGLVSPKCIVGWEMRVIIVVCIYSMNENPSQAGELSTDTAVTSSSSSRVLDVCEVGIVSPGLIPIRRLTAGQIGYMCTKQSSLQQLQAGDKLTPASPQQSHIHSHRSAAPPPAHSTTRTVHDSSTAKPRLTPSSTNNSSIDRGHLSHDTSKSSNNGEFSMQVSSLVYAGVYPMSGDQTEKLKAAMSKLLLNDPSIDYQPQLSDSLGYGFRCGFLGRLHMDVFRQRLETEHDLKVLITAPTVPYLVTLADGVTKKTVYSASEFPDHFSRVEEPMVRAIISRIPWNCQSAVTALCFDTRAQLLGYSVELWRAGGRSDAVAADLKTAADNTPDRCTLESHEELCNHGSIAANNPNLTSSRYTTPCIPPHPTSHPTNTPSSVPPCQPTVPDRYPYSTTSPHCPSSDTRHVHSPSVPLSCGTTHPTLLINMTPPHSNSTPHPPSCSYDQPRGVGGECVLPSVEYRIPLGSVISNFHERLQKCTHGLAEYSHSLDGYEPVNAVKATVRLNGKAVEELSFLTLREEARVRGGRVVRMLADHIAPHDFEVTVQCVVGGKVMAREKVKAVKKDILAKCYGGDVTRKMKLIEREKAVQTRNRLCGVVRVPPEAFIDMIKL
eukprot:GHVQ01027008.1.p1 GENE.GHVQ01027008.1~~GHVQ01027008.1.p1  ORF type:complete len:625 (+),score=110.65 GHVQ01027008.1:149-2023(+)